MTRPETRPAPAAPSIRGRRMTNQAQDREAHRRRQDLSSCRSISGTIGPDVLDIRKLYAEAGVFTYDPGFTSTGACESAITYIDGDKGELLYRGYPIEQLAEKSHFLEVCYLLLYGELPTAAAARGFREPGDQPHDAARADALFLPRLPPRRAPDGDRLRRGRRDVGLLPRLHRHQRRLAARGAPRSG